MPAGGVALPESPSQPDDAPSMSTGEQADGGEATSVYALIYQYAADAETHMVAATERLQQKARHFMTIHIVLFAGLAFALEEVVAGQRSGRLIWWLTVSLGMLAGVLLFVAFSFAILIMWIRPMPQVGVARLRKQLTTGAAAKETLATLYAGLAGNRLTAVQERRRESHRRRWMVNWMCQLTLVGGLAAGASVATSVADALLAISRNEPTETSPMMDSIDPKKTPKDENGDDEPSDMDSNPFSEPSEWVEHDADETDTQRRGGERD